MTDHTMDNGYTLDDDELPAGAPTLTPRPATDSRDADRCSLNGTWTFAAGSGAKPPTAPSDRRRHPVPGQWNYQGIDVGADERGWYHRTFAVPERWAERRLVIRFDGAYSDAVVWVNGERVGEHVGGYTPFEVDVTDAVDVGDDNVLEVGVMNASPADTMAQASLGGGITRDVTLLSVPTCYVSDLDIVTTIGDDRATVETGVSLTNGSDHSVDATVRATLTDPSGEEVRVLERDVEGIDAGTGRDLDLEFALEDFVTWNPEQPRLYDLRCELEAENECERIDHHIGIREIEVDGNQLLLNGRPITLRGVNWRESHPDHEQAVPAEIARRDVEQLREANVNYVRTGHHPPSEAFVEACDEAGILVEMEAAIAGVRFGKAYFADDPSYRKVLCRQLLELVERDKNRTSVGIWSLANESEWGPNFEAAARLASAADPTRPTTFNWGMYLDDDVGFCDVANHHYPALRDSKVDLEEFEESDRPVMFGEFCHTYCYNVKELGTDPGLRDDYVRVLERGWERVNELDAFAGAAIWAGLDHLSPEWRWGLLDKYRRCRPEYHHVKKIYSSVELTAIEWRDAGVDIELENRSTFVGLGERQLEWEAGGESGCLEIDAAPGETGRATVPVPAEASSFTLRVLHPHGFTIDEFERRRNDSESDRDLVDAAAATDPSLTRTETAIRLETDGCSLTVDRNVGTVEVGRLGGEPIISGIPAVVATVQESNVSTSPRYVGSAGGRLHPWRCEEVRVTDDGAGVEIRGGYYYDTIDVASGSFAFRVGEDGRLDVEYDFTLSEDRTVRETGIALPVAGDCDTLTWERDSRWSTYPSDHVGRSSGTAAAFPGERPTDEVMELDRSRPWSADATANGSNDFRSTKRHVREARLSAEDGRSVAVRADGDRHVRCSVGSDTIDLNVLDRSFVGVGLGLLDRHALLGEEPTLEAGTRLRGTVMIEISD
ncbi:hypothetical protein OB955_22530 [Halobacteria archaeon AArc-m2/3/4]|uniref:beta-galactosidase n=1 Tax=Natronoglomus mannanivorans TaxID=2979990 RepID=A0ABT2QKK1_9EURY|nr:hypothetical protein [Halobacteria archaeon AArc-m2/3/4]